VKAARRRARRRVRGACFVAGDALDLGAALRKDGKLLDAAARRVVMSQQKLEHIKDVAAEQGRAFGEWEFFRVVAGANGRGCAFDGDDLIERVAVDRPFRGRSER